MAEKTNETIALRLVNAEIKDMALSDVGGGVYEITTKGGDPYVMTAPFGPGFDARRHHVLAFEYFCAAGLDSFQVYFGPNIREGRSVEGTAPGMSEGWVEYAVDLAKSPAWGADCEYLRLDFGKRLDKTIRVRNLHLRPPTAREEELARNRERRRAADARLEAALTAYLATDFPARVTAVAAAADEITITGDRPAGAGVFLLAESPLYENITEVSRFVHTEPLEDAAAGAGRGEFALRVPRYVERDGRRYDRIFSRWAIVEQTPAGLALRSHARYADTLPSRWDPPQPRPASKKGLGGFSAGRAPVSDLDDLGIRSVTVNVCLTDFMRSAPGQGNLAFEYNAKTYYADRKRIDHFDETFREAAARDILVSAIILIRKASQTPDPVLGPIFEHPDCDPAGIYSMANVTSAEGLEYYAAALHFLAERYSRPDAQYGRIHHYILHNEIDAGWVWTNCGPKPPLVYMDLYHKSMRTAHYIARQFDPRAKVFISLTHYWNWTVDARFYLPRRQLDQLLDFSRAEGDFDWAIAQHPYPESLFEPRCWEDKKPTFSFDTPLITYKNIEVLDAWVRQPRTFFQGRRQRTLHLTEQGMNSRDYSEEALRNQAAGMAYAWKKIKHLDSIEANQYHNWTDSAGEGGLLIGLRKLNRGHNETGDPRKPIWYLYAKLDTPEEDAACEFAREMVGVKDWDEVRHKGPIT